MRFNFSCTCGAHWQGNVDEYAVGLLSVAWAKKHVGPGHGDCTPREAGRVRAKTERVPVAGGPGYQEVAKRIADMSRAVSVRRVVADEQMATG